MICLLPGLRQQTRAPGRRSARARGLFVQPYGESLAQRPGAGCRQAPEAVDASAVPDTAPSKEVRRVVQVVSTPALSGHFPAGRVRSLHVADAIHDLPLDRVSFAAQVGHMNGERAIAHGSGAPLGELVQELVQGPPVMWACSQDAQ